ncbi:hypothetical protein WICPIJ_004366 [Wickerhamomyces pijperi]|uniref:Pre-mRNA-splicing factor RSE1 n=1 Tax=Wickerhamomyces pijperi TaxID=599730 RepID=A0A9P8TMZ0_WICPI|nr:hypothetical protein WICPIJ_004366 [Wickerhamomyces pijperi]
MSSIPELCLYNTTLHHNKSSIRSISGHFTSSSSKTPELIITATSDSLIVYKPNKETGKLTQLFQSKTFAIIRSIANFQIANSGKDYIAVTSDSGNLTLLELDLQNRRFVSLFNEPFAKSGIRRLSPGEDLCVDSKGRALFVSAIERNKLLYVVNRDLENQLTVSSPLEANRVKVLTYTTIGLDVGYDNPQFAAIETDYSDFEDQETTTTTTAAFNSKTKKQRTLTYYELDLGLNHVLMKHQEETFPTANFLLHVPGGSDGPSGVIVCSEGLISYRNLQGDKLSVAIPTHSSHRDQPTYVVAGVTHKIKNEFFFLVQTNHRDLFKITLPQDRTLTISYFDTLPSVVTSLIVLKSGYLFADSEYGDKYFLQFESLGPEVPEFVSAVDTVDSHACDFERHEELVNLSLTDLIETLNPLLATSVTPSGQILALSGLATQSTFKTIDRGVKVEEIVESEVPGIADKIFTTKITKKDPFDKYLILSFLNSTLVLEIGESVEEVLDSGLVLTEATLGVQQVGEAGLLQILANKIVSFQNGVKTSEWLAPGGIKISHCSTNNRQVLVSLSSNEVVYFEVDEYDRLIEYQTHYESECRVTAVSVGDIPAGRLRCPFMAVAFEDSLVRVFSCGPENVLEVLALQVVADVACSLSITNDSSYINIGMNNGLFSRSQLNARTGEFVGSSQRTKYLGNKPVQLSTTYIGEVPHVLALSSDPWLVHQDPTSAVLNICPLLTDNLNSACSLSNENFKNCVVSVYSKTLKIFELSNSDISANPLQIQGLELKDTARQIITYDKEVFVIGNTYVYGFEKGSGEISKSLDLDHSFKCHSAAIVKFANDKGTFLCLSITNSATGDSFIQSVNLVTFKAVHKTKLSQVSLSIVEFQEMLLVSTGSDLRLFDMGMKQLLSKSVSPLTTINRIVQVENAGDQRVIVGDVRESLTFLKYDQQLKEFAPFADDILPRHVTSFKSLDHDTAIGGDKFGNLFVLRLDRDTSKLVDTEPASAIGNNNPSRSLNGSKFKLNNLVNFFIQDIPLSFHLTSLTSGGQQVVLYSCLQGTIGSLIPLVTKSDILFFTNLQRVMRFHCVDVTGRSNLKYRGYYQPVKNCIDGDLVELFDTLSEEVQVKIAKECSKSVEEIKRKIFEVRAGSI